ncbi:metal ABC transporter permease [Thiolapillus brandeum]|uniref:Metal ion ABC transporter permease n=1 Tax=Thiolapillus brandeum TaxID=1076588 RepID=A0A7U6JH95_9GAMM|nr:metal ABC transporter permease [Thiolapillus brandeum]BAO43463.1 metal ion ABC transporter permease [Thiolapillus brandeum]
MSELFDWRIVGPPLLAGLLVLSTHVLLGREVLRRGIIFIDLAIAQIAVLGVIVAQLLGWPEGGWQTQAAALAAALMGALLLHGFERFWPRQQEALIGISFVLAASGALLLSAGSPHGAEHLQELLSGQLLWVGWRQLQWIAGLYVLILLAWNLLGYQGRRFYLLFALAVTASVQVVGVYLVFASLIIPALAIRHLPRKQGLVAGYVIGGMAYAGGLLLSSWYDWPAGPVVVWLLGVVALCAGWLATAVGMAATGRD